MFINKVAALNHVLSQLHLRAGFKPHEHPQVFVKTATWIEHQLQDAKLWDEEPCPDTLAAIAAELEDLCAPVVGLGLKAHAHNDPVISDMIRDIRYQNLEQSPVSVAYAQFAYLLVANA